MRVGILTFHWATNYGAVLQAYALQSYLSSLGFVVRIINYKPKQYDYSLWNFLKYRRFIHLSEYLASLRKEIAIDRFRRAKLCLTDRIYLCKDITTVVEDFDILIAGSDQVLNPGFLLNGEGKNKRSLAYFLGFPFVGKRIGYALSFGCTIYPPQAIYLAKESIIQFDAFSVRESSGIKIAQSMGRDDAFLVPDPTILLPSSFYSALFTKDTFSSPSEYNYCFFIRNIKERRSQIHVFQSIQPQLWNNDDCSYSVSDWLRKIYYSQLVLTDSFHCVVMCLMFHKPFVIIPKDIGKGGMNDRMYTLLSLLLLENRIVVNMADVELIAQQSIDWIQVDSRIEEFRRIGIGYLHQNLGIKC